MLGAWDELDAELALLREGRLDGEEDWAESEAMSGRVGDRGIA